MRPLQGNVAAGGSHEDPGRAACRAPTGRSRPPRQAPADTEPRRRPASRARAAWPGRVTRERAAERADRRRDAGHVGDPTAFEPVGVRLDERHRTGRNRDAEDDPRRDSRQSPATARTSQSRSPPAASARPAAARDRTHRARRRAAVARPRRPRTGRLPARPARSADRPTSTASTGPTIAITMRAAWFMQFAAASGKVTRASIKQTPSSRPEPSAARRSGGTYFVAASKQVPRLRRLFGGCRSG